MKIRTIIVLIMVTLTIMVVTGCLISPKPVRSIATWVDNDWTTYARSWSCISRNFEAGDTLEINLILRAGDYADKVFFTDSSEYAHWANNENSYLLWKKDHFVGAGSYTVRVPTDGKYYFVVYNDAYFATIKLSVLLKVISW
jgi:hypothetical protein